ncbi:MAG: NHL repeat-containing protein [Candidatus Firestonebacteria bacterium]
MNRILVLLILFFSSLLFSADYNALYFAQDGSFHALSGEEIVNFNFDGGEETRVAEELFRPFAFARFKSGVFVVADSGNSCVKFISNSGECLNTFGKKNSAEGGLIKPLGLALDLKENIIVSDTGNDRIKIFDNNGKFLRKFGKRGYGNDEFLNPFHVFTDNADNIYVVDPGNICVKKFDNSGKFLLKFSETLISASDAALSPSGDLYICDFKDRAVKIFSEDGKFKGYYRDRFFYQSPVLIAVNKAGAIAVYDSGKKQLEVSDAAGKQLYSSGKGSPDWAGPLYAVAAAGGNIYTSSNSSMSVRKYDNKGKQLSSLGGFGTAPGLFHQPRGIAIDSRGRVFVCDSFNGRIECFSNEGAFLGEFGPFDWPLQLAIDREDNLYVCESGTSSIIKIKAFSDSLNFQPSNTLNIKPSTFFSPGALAINKNGLIGVVNTLTKAFMILDKTGKELVSFDFSFKAPVSAAAGEDGSFYVYDAYNMEASRFEDLKLSGTSKLKTDGRRGKWGGIFHLDGKLKFFNGNALLEIGSNFK